MEWFYIILLGFVAVGLALFLFLLYSGAFYTYTIRCSIPASLPEKFAYTVHVGPYSNVGTPCCELAALVPHLTTCVVYYDNPNKVRIILLPGTKERMIGNHSHITGVIYIHMK